MLMSISKFKPAPDQMTIGNNQIGLLYLVGNIEYFGVIDLGWWWGNDNKNDGELLSTDKDFYDFALLASGTTSTDYYNEHKDTDKIVDVTVTVNNKKIVAYPDNALKLRDFFKYFGPLYFMPATTSATSFSDSADAIVNNTSSTETELKKVTPVTRNAVKLTSMHRPTTTNDNTAGASATSLHIACCAIDLNMLDVDIEQFKFICSLYNHVFMHGSTISTIVKDVPSIDPENDGKLNVNSEKKAFDVDGRKFKLFEMQLKFKPDMVTIINNSLPTKDSSGNNAPITFNQVRSVKVPTDIYNFLFTDGTDVITINGNKYNGIWKTLRLNVKNAESPPPALSYIHLGFMPTEGVGWNGNKTVKWIWDPSSGSSNVTPEPILAYNYVDLCETLNTHLEENNE